MRILLVEDEEKLANAIKRALITQKYTVDVVYDGEQGLDLAIGEKYDVIILDVMLPKISGIEISKKVRNERIATPIIMLTALGQTKDKINGLDAGADDYLVKPFSFEELFARVRALLRRSSKNQENVLTIKDLTLDPVNFIVTRAGRTIQLSLKEFSILEYLMRYKNMTVTRDQIVQSVWNYDADILPTTTEVHIKHLRDKIDKPFDTQLIKTIRGFGYVILDN
ncbi:response regulator transcription factor [Candidatus Woesebacteria bacterium]|nr:MAG: response regulator transcription factor [Candidatus Woesebacteria bacterium]